MARTTHVKRAQQRYETKPVLDEFGNQVETAVMKTVTDRETGAKTRVQKTTKRGKPVFMKVTERDLEKPLPLYVCDACNERIEIGTPYKHITPKSGPYGGRQRNRHESCPGWQVWDYSNSMSAQLARISYDFTSAVDSAESTDDIQSALDDASSSITEIAEQKREGASNIESGFGHSTSQSEELESMADELDQWASDVTSADIPEVTTCEECNDGQKDCDACDGTGQIDLEECDDCSGSGEIECDNCDGSGEDIEAWRDEVRDNVTIVDESPV